MPLITSLKLALEFIQARYDNSIVTAITCINDTPRYTFSYLLNDIPIWHTINLKKEFEHARVNDTYFTTLGRAIDYAFDTAQIKGYEVITEHSAIAEAIDYLHTRSYHFDLTKDGKLQSKQLHVIIYRMNSGNYELTHYIN